MKNKSNMLLQEMQDAVSCAYLSDMRNTVLGEQAKKKIAAIDDDRYTVDEWNEAVSYVTNSHCSFLTVEDAKKTIINLK